MNRSRFRLLLLGCALGVSGAAGSVAEDADPALALGHRVEQAVLESDYARARSIAVEFRAAYPDDPAGPLMLASILQYESVDYEDFSKGPELAELLAETDRLAVHRLEQDRHDLWAQYCRGAADGLGAAYASLSGDKLAAMVRGRSGAARMAGIIDRDPEFHDAYLLHGSYLFWKSNATSKMTWLPFVGNNKEQGIAEIEQAISGGRLFGPLSNTVLMDILLTHDPEQAREVGERLIAQYPSCRLFAWQLGEAYKKLGRMADARAVFTRIAGQMREDPSDDGSGVLRCWWKLAVLAHDLGDPAECAHYCGLVAEMANSPAVAGRQQQRIDTARQLMKEHQ